jgi:adenine deaminase
MTDIKTISGNIVDLIHHSIYPGTLTITGEKISGITHDHAVYDTYLIPGLIDAHIHIESSMLAPTEFARLAAPHGTVATVSDPHEIANVMGAAGIEFMLANGDLTPFKFAFGIPSCVPATGFESAGATIDAATVAQLAQTGRLRYLGELMNVPGVLNDDPEVMAKIRTVRQHGYPIDGHAPELSGTALARYIAAGITTDHEIASYAEAEAKINLGMKIQIREGSAAQNFAALHPLIDRYPEHCMFCSDDRHPHHLSAGHIDQMVRQALGFGYDPFKVLQVASLNPIRHYQLAVGLLQPGDPADVVVINNFTEFQVLRTYIQGRLVAANGRCLLPPAPILKINNFHAQPKQAADFTIAATGDPTLNVIGVIEGQLLTKWLRVPAQIVAGQAVSDPARDLLKLTVVNRYQNAPPVVGFIQNTGLQTGAIAASVAHDSHNIIAMGISDADIAAAVNLVIEHQGGLAVISDTEREILPLPIAGLMSDQDGATVARQYTKLLATVQNLGCRLHDPFMTLSFMALPVIPDLKLTATGLFDARRFKPVGLFEQ